MLYKEEILKIVKKIVYQDKIEIEKLERAIALEEHDTLLIIINEFWLRISFNNGTFLLEEIKIIPKLRNKGICTKLIKEFILFCKKQDEINSFKVGAIVSNSMKDICKKNEMEEIPCEFYGTIDDDFDFDDYLGSMIIDTRN